MKMNLCDLLMKECNVFLDRYRHYTLGHLCRCESTPIASRVKELHFKKDFKVEDVAAKKKRRVGPVLGMATCRHALVPDCTVSSPPCSVRAQASGCVCNCGRYVTLPNRRTEPWRLRRSLTIRRPCHHDAVHCYHEKNSQPTLTKR
ncbi:hypothetical protein EVAR_87510_1 [Eumeta japonica]|uniref:Uncharacterized protein n=1 Tax=Eumeta variegata TaxID=151549 RepID=A0A4C1ZBP3_EUMVA|nr:hypothetical protein EVAR_87510_1 [Eumeta japonica]